MKANKVSKINRLSIKVLALSFGIWSAAQLGFVPSGYGADPDPSVEGQWGKVLKEVTTNPAVYTFKGDEVYIRAKVIESNGKAAWTQPVFLKKQ